MKPSIPAILITVLFACFALALRAQAVVPPPDGGYPGGNTAEGQNALLSLTTGVNNTAVGWFSLKSNTNGQLNTALGAGTLFSTVHASRNTAIGGAALFSDTDGSSNTAVGALTLFHNTSGDFNTAIGDNALFNNIEGFRNTANGYLALFSNTTGNANTASGASALRFNATGTANTAIGDTVLLVSDGSFNTGIGASALAVNQTANSNTAVGAGALPHPGGDFNTALGVNAGYEIIGANNIVIGANVAGSPGESNTIRIGNADITDTFIGGISGTTVASGAAVLVDSSGHLGTVASSERFKKDIATMDKTSEAILLLRPVTFHYKTDTKGTPQFGLIAEEVAKVNPALVLPDKEGKPYTVRYDQVNAMLLNEFLKARRQIDAQQKQIDALTVGLQKVSAQLETSKPTSQMVNNP
jgi:Chaperone of endosialidase